MARGKKDDGAGTKDMEKLPAVKPSDVKQVITQTKLVNLMKAKRGAAKDTGEINGRVGEMIASAVENQHLHRKAFGTIMQLDRMEPEKVADFLDNFHYYLDISGIQKRADSVMKMDLPRETKAEGEAGEPAGSNVSKFPQTTGTA